MKERSMAKHTRKNQHDGPSYDEFDRAISSAQHQYDPDSRTFYIYEDITLDLARSFIPMFRAIDSTPGDITIMICSGGGDCYAGNAIFTAINNARNRTTIIGCGMVFSMAAVLLQAADERILEENCRFMFHDVSIATLRDVPYHQLMNISKDAQALLDYNLKVISDRSGIPMNELRNISRQEIWMSAKEAVKHGFADKVIKLKKKGK